MQMNQQLVDLVTDYVQRRSWRARKSNHTRRIVHIALFNLQNAQRNIPVAEFGLQSYIKHKVLTQLKTTESWYVVQYILYWLLDVIIELVIKWWLSQQEK
jgi:hypothetical protein